MGKWGIYKRLLKNSLIFWGVTVVLFTAERRMMLDYFVPDAVKKQFKQDLSPLFIKGMLFDIKIASVLTALPFLLGLFSLSHHKTAQKYRYVQPYLMTVLLAAVVALAIGNWFYFVVYGHQFDVFVFGLADEDTQAVLKTIWADYPVIKGLLAVVFVAFAFFGLLRKTDKMPSESQTAGKVVWIVAILLPVLLLAAGIRGSFGKFPLRQSAAQISGSPQLNKLVPNAAVSLEWAVKEYRNSSHFEVVSDETGSQIISRLKGVQASADLKHFESKTAKNPPVERHQPNVVFAVMESMGLHLLTMDNAQRNLLGELEKHWQTDWVYQKFISEGDGTSDSLHRFFIRSPRLDLSQSVAKNKKFPSNMFKPYLDAGYKVVYITAGNGGWRDFDNFLRRLGVQEIVDENTLKAHYPEAKSGDWGVADEFMFRYAEEMLHKAEHDKQPLFIMMLSVTNHPPYRLPESEKRRDFKLTASEQQRLSGFTSGKELNEVFNTYRYSNDQLGKFITDVKKNAPDTIIAATGDHNIRAISYPETAEVALGHGVPFYLYVPEAYRSQAVYQPGRAGSHKDIMPTLYNLSLSEKTYYQTGCNLTAVQIDPVWCGYGYNPEVLVLDKGVYHLGSKEFRLWKEQGILSAETKPVHAEEAEQRLIRQGSAYTEFLNWQINRMVTAQ